MKDKLTFNFVQVDNQAHPYQIYRIHSYIDNRVHGIFVDNLSEPIDHRNNLVLLEFIYSHLLLM